MIQILRQILKDADRQDTSNFKLQHSEFWRFVKIGCVLLIMPLSMWNNEIIFSLSRSVYQM